MEEGKKRSRVGGKMEEEKHRRNSRRRFQAGEPRAGEHSCGLPRALWLPSSCGPNAAYEGAGEPAGGQLKLQHYGQARPAKPRREAGDAGEPGSHPRRQGASAAERSRRNQYRGERLAEVGQHRLQASESRDQPPPPPLPAPHSLSLCILLQQSQNQPGPAP